MNAHDQLERQLRAGVAGKARRRRRPAVRTVLAVGITGVTVAVVLVAVLALRPASHATLPAGPGTASPDAAEPPNPGPIPKDVDDAVVANSWNIVWAKDAACSPRLGDRPREVDASPSAAMVAHVPLLSRPRTPADVLPGNLYSGELRGPFQGDVEVRYIRRARTADGSTFWLVPEADLGRAPATAAVADRCEHQEVAALAAQLSRVPAVERTPTRRYGDAEFALGRYNLEHSSVHAGVVLVTRASSPRAQSVAVNVFSLAEIEHGGQLGGGGGGKPYRPILVYGVAPAGVASVTLNFPPSRYRGRHLPSRSVTGRVVNDVFVMRVPTLFERGGWPEDAIWRSASGAVIKIVNEKPFHP